MPAYDNYVFLGSRSENKLSRMTRTVLSLILLLILSLSCTRQPRSGNQNSDAEQRAKSLPSDGDKSPHTVQLVTADNNVKLEVLDWGGSGRALVLLAGLGDTAHIYDEFATKLTGTYHVYGVTRRGFGASSVPDSGYSADRLGDDVLAVIDSLRLTRPILVGHSIAGEELSSVGSRHPEKVAGLVYLEAAYFYAYYDASRGNLTLDALDVQRKLDQLQSGRGPTDQKVLRELLNGDLPQLQKDLKETVKDLEGAPPPSQPPPPPEPPPSSEFSPTQAILHGMQKYTKISVPVLAIQAFPRRLGPEETGDDPASRDAYKAKMLKLVGAQIKAFRSGVPSARVITLPDADHYIYRSNEAGVLREINLFVSSLK
jgi:pimeloyl-ACP methyl ester carboxylesterase